MQSKVCIFHSGGWYLSMLAKVVKYYHRSKESSNKIQILEMKFEFGKKNLTSLDKIGEQNMRLC